MSLKTILRYSRDYLTGQRSVGVIHVYVFIGSL